MGVARDWNPPGEAGSRDRQVAQARLYKADDLVAPAARRDGIRVRVIIGQQPLLPRREPGKVVLLFHPLALGARRRLPVHHLALVVTSLVAHRLPPVEAS